MEPEQVHMDKKEAFIMKKKFIKITLAAALSLAMAGTSFAGEWQWLDSNSDGIAECYYMENGSPLM